MCAVAVRGGFDRKVEPSRLRSHLGYLITTVVSLHVVGYSLLIAPPTPHVPSARQQVAHLRLIPHGAQSTQLGSSDPGRAGAGQENNPGGAGQGMLSPSLAELAAASVAAGGGGSTGVLLPPGGVVPAEPEAAEILSRAEVPAAPDDNSMLDDLRTQAQQVSEGLVTDGANEYLPRSMLTVGPQSQGAVLIEFPVQASQIGHFSTVLALFIDEAGVVRRIRVDGNALPAPFEEAARRGFLNARFRPGQLHGQVVKSLIHVEVVFDNTAMDADRGVKSLSFSL